MEMRKIFLYVALAFIAIMLWSNWNHYQMQKHVAQTHQGANTTQQDNNLMQGAAGANQANAAPVPTKAAIKVDKSNWIKVNTDLMQVAIDLKGGNVSSIALNKYSASEKPGSPPVHILTSGANDGYYVTQSGVMSSDGKPQNDIIFTSSSKKYSLQDGQNKISVVLHGKTKDGLSITRTYTFSRNKYAFNISNTLDNTTAAQWKGNQYMALVRQSNAADKHHMRRTYAGAAISSSNTPYHKVSYDHLKKNNINQR